MKIIVAHPAMDFDALASMLAAQRLWPEAKLVSLSKPAHNVQDFMALHKESIQIQNYINKDDVDAMILVDTRSGARLQEFAPVAARPDISICIYDHHPRSDSEIEGAELHISDTGANVTQLVELIAEQGIEISAQDATVMALGIYEDTGSLCYSNTTVRDLKAAAFLLEHGANLSVVANYIAHPLNNEQEALMRELLNTSHIEKIHGFDVLFATAVCKDFVGDLAILTAKLRDLHTVSAVFTIVAMGKRTYIVARSNTDRINVHTILRPYGGGGYDRASSAVIKEKPPSVEELHEHLIELVRDNTVAPPTIGEIMTSPVKTIDCNITMQEVEKYLLRYGHSGYPVMKNGELVGIVSRRDVEKAKYHGLGRLPVKGYMSHHVHTIDINAPLDEARALMIRENIGRLPVTKDGELVGIVSRSDLLRLMYGEKSIPQSSYRVPYATGDISLLPQMRSALPPATLDLLGEIASLADRENFTVFLVGGFVRDILLGELSFDVDLVVEGNGIAFAQLVAECFGGQCTSYEKFGTAHVQIKNYMGIDIASARTEFYEYPAALPQVENGTLRQDLYRRDFTINAMAVSLNFHSIGRLIDYYNGKEDLERHQLRILYNLSFVEDPTRIMRALRFVVRYGFKMEEETERLAHKAVADSVFEQLSFRRIWQEVMLSLQEHDPYSILLKLEEYGIWPYIFPNHPLDHSLKQCAELMEVGIHRIHNIEHTPDVVLIWSLLLTYNFSRSDLDAFFAQLEGHRRYKEAAYGLLNLRRFTNGDNYATPAAWYFFLHSTLLPEQVIALYLKSGESRREAIIKNYEAFRRIHIEATRADLKTLDNYDKSMYRAIIEDMAEQKLLNQLPTLNDELNYAAANIRSGKYDKS